MIIEITAKFPLDQIISGLCPEVADKQRMPVQNIVPFENAATLRLKLPIVAAIGAESCQFRQLHTHETSLAH